MNKKLLIIISLSAILASPFFGSSGPFPSFYVFKTIRIPRVLLGILAGGTLSLCGMVFQNIFKSTLATPYTLGTSSGAAFGAAVAIACRFSSLAVTGSAFAGAAGAIAIVYAVFHLKKNCRLSDMILIGVAVNFFFSSLLLMIHYLVDYHRTFEIIHWLLGKLTTGTNERLLYLTPLVLIFTYIFMQSLELDLLAAGDDIAHSRGVEVKKLRRKLFLAVSIATASIVSICGTISFVGMISPHICRKIVGTNHKQLIPLSILFGAAFLTFSDALARTIISPAEIPVGIITALCGGPFFLILLIRSKEL